MLAKLYWITDFLATMPRPRGNDWIEDEILSYKKSGVGVVVSLLEQNEIYELEIEKEEFWCLENEIVFLNFPIGDRQTPKSFTETLEFVKKLQNFIAEGKKAAIHCRQGIGRASLIAACLLVLRGISVESAFEKITESRRCEVPDTQEQINWVKSFAQKINENQK